MSGPSFRAKRRTPKNKTPKAVFDDTNEKKTKWSVGEMKRLADGLEKYGFGDIPKLAQVVKTRTENEVKYFMEKWTDRVFRRNAKSVEAGDTSANQLYKLFSKNSKDTNYSNFPPIGLWKKVILSITSSRHKGIDYSKIIVDLFNRFAEEEEPYKFEGLPNLKQVYGYLADTLSGNTPAKLSPENNIILNYLFADLKNFMQANDLAESKKFFEGFLGPVQFQSSENEEDTCKILQEFLEEKLGLRTNVDADMEEAGPSGHHPDTQCKSDGPSTSTGAPVPSACSDERNAENQPDPVAEKKPEQGFSKGPVVEVPPVMYKLYKSHEKICTNINPLVVPIYLQSDVQTQIDKYYKV